MPYDSNGVATVDRQVAVTGQTVLAVQVNVPFADIQSMLSQVLLRSGVAPMDGNLPMAGFKITNLANGTADGDAVNYSQLLLKAGALQPYVEVASAATTDIGAAASENVTITGTTTITSFGTVAAGTVRDLTFSGALTITHNATSLITPSGANIVTVAGQSLRAVSLGSGNWRVTTDTNTLTAGAGLTSTGTLASGMTLTVELTELGAVTTLASPRVVVTDGVTAGTSARMVPDDFKKTFEVSGFYTGSNANLTDYPVGTELLVDRDGAASLNRNQTGSVYYKGSNSREFSRAPTGNTLLSGTWISKGTVGDIVAMQKIAS